MIEMVKVAEVKPYDNNPRIHNIEEIKKSIQRYDFNVPILVDKEGVIISGHGRYAALKALEKEEIPVIRITDLSDELVKEFRIADNSISAIADWNLDYLEQEIRAIAEATKLAGFSAHEIQTFLSDIGGYQGFTEEDIQKAEQERTEHFKELAEAVHENYLELTCEECGETFFVNLDTILKYYN